MNVKMPLSSKEYDIVILGHIAKDVITIDDKSRDAIGGAVYYGGIAGSHMGLKILVITRLMKDDECILANFKKHGIQYCVSYSGETTGIKNIYDSKDMEYRECKPMGFAGAFSKEDIPDVSTKFFVLAPLVVGEIDTELLDFLEEKFPGRICMDIQGFVRVRDVKKDHIHFCNLSEQHKNAILSKIAILKVDHAEALALTGESDITVAARILSELGPKEILITHEKGISLYAKGKLYSYPWKNKSMIGRTGRGDTAFISYVGSRIEKSPKEALKFATALTSLKLEHPGPFNLPLNLVEQVLRELH